MRNIAWISVSVSLVVLASCTTYIGTTNADRGWYFAGSKIKDEKALGGYGPCNNYPKKCKVEAPDKHGKIELVAFSDKPFQLGSYRGMALHLINHTDETVSFPACDSRLYIVQEAFAPDGQWKPLETFATSFCGNSYHRVFLPPGEYWEFLAPRHNGTYRTKLRFRLQFGDNQNRDGVRKLYSDEFDGGVNPVFFIKNDTYDGWLSFVPQYFSKRVFGPVEIHFFLKIVAAGLPLVLVICLRKNKLRLLWGLILTIGFLTVAVVLTGRGWVEVFQYPLISGLEMVATIWYRECVASTIALFGMSLILAHLTRKFCRRVCRPRIEHG